jgi:hypothetical protein
MICGAIAVYVLQPQLENQWDVDSADDENKFIYAYTAYGVFCLALYFFVIAPMLALPEIDMSQVQFSGSSVFAIGALIFGGKALTMKAPAPKKAA